MMSLMRNMSRGSSGVSGFSESGAVAGKSWLSEGLCVLMIPEVYVGWNDPQVSL